MGENARFERRGKEGRVRSQRLRFGWVAGVACLVAYASAPAFGAEPISGRRLLLGLAVSEGAGGFDSGKGSTHATLVPAPSLRVSYFLTERLELNGGATYQQIPFKFSGTSCVGPWNEVLSFSFLDVATRYNSDLGKTGFWFVTGGLLGGVVLHHYHDYLDTPYSGFGKMTFQQISSGERGSPAFGAKVQAGGGTWITPSVRWNAGVEFYMGYTIFQFLGETQAAPFGQLSVLLGMDFGLF